MVHRETSLKDYWDEKPGETAAGQRGHECPRCYLGAPALGKVYGPVHEEGVLRSDRGRLAEVMVVTETHGAVGPKSWLRLRWPGHKHETAGSTSPITCSPSNVIGGTILPGFWSQKIKPTGRESAFNFQKQGAWIE